MKIKNFDNKKNELIPFSNNNIVVGDIIFFDRKNENIKLCINSVYRIILNVSNCEFFNEKTQCIIDMSTGEFI